MRPTYGDEAKWFFERSALYKERYTLRAEVEQLRQALRSVIVAAGGVAAPDVSTEFLLQAPLEVLALRGNLDQLQAKLRRAEQDAARYQLLREQQAMAADEDPDFAVMRFDGYVGQWLHINFDLDAEIDAYLEDNQ